MDITTLGCLRRAAISAFAIPTLALMGCGGDGGPSAETCNVYAWEPGVGDMSSFPTSEVLTEDASEPTGFRVQLPDNFDLTQFGPLGPSFRDQLGTLDGVGLQGEMWLGFSGTFDASLLPVTDGQVRATDGLGILVLPQNDEPYLVPVETRTSTNFLYVRPLRPLPDATRIAVFATRALSAAAGGCLEPLATMRNLLRRPDDDRSEAIEALTGLGTIESWRDLVSLHVVTTQSATRESVAIAQHIETLSPTMTDFDCTVDETHRYCTAMLEVEDYRGQDGAVSIDVNNVVPTRRWELPVAIWLPPASVEGPYPTIIYGHGINGDRNQANLFSVEFAERGWATVAIDAVVHGEHPSTEGMVLDGLGATLRFFALELGLEPRLEALRLRDHFRQSTYDKLQFTRALTTVGDLDGNGSRDVDSERLIYFGVSLGGLMSSELAAMSGSFSGVVNMVGGGTYSRLVADPESSFSFLVRFVLGQQTRDQVAQALSMLQSVFDAGDSAVYAQHILGNRLRDPAAIPDYFFGVVLGDGTVPNSSNYALARALGLPLVGTVLRPVVGVPVATDPLPLSGNGAEGTTAGLMQFDVVNAEGEVATHNNMPTSPVGLEAIWSFCTSHFEDGSATLVDPYMVLGVPHATPAP